MNACFVANAGGDLAQMSSQVKMKEEDFKEEFNPWNKDVKLLEKMQPGGLDVVEACCKKAHK